MTKVTCAIIIEDHRVLVTQRSETMPHGLKWEFPGGKVKQDESPEYCINREIEEELGLKIHVLRQLPSVLHTYKKGSIELIPFICSIEQGEVFLKEHKAFQWVPMDKLDHIDWLEADVEVVRLLKSYYSNAT